MCFKKQILILPFIALSLIFIKQKGFTQNNNFQTYSIEEGLPQSNVYCIIQDTKNYLWIGTGGGVSHFDGNIFKTYSKKNGIAGNTIRALMEDSQQRIWIGTDEGLSVYDGYGFTTINKDNGLQGSSVISLFEDVAHNIWVGTDDGGVNRIKNYSKDTFTIDNYSLNVGMSNPIVFDIYEDKSNRIWLATFGGINILTFTNDTPKVDVLLGEYDIPSNMILSIKEDNTGNIWIGTYDVGAFKMVSSEGENWSVVTFDALSHGSVWGVYCRDNGDVWFGTGEGIKRILPNSKNDSLNIVSYTDEQGLSSNQIACILEDNEKNIWLGTNGAGLCKYMGDHFAHYSEKEGLPSNIVQDIKQDKYGNYWIASDGGGLTRMYFVNDKPVFNNYNTSNGMPCNETSSIAIDSKNNVWMATQRCGITQFDGNKFFNVSKEKDGLHDNSVNYVFVDSKDFLWCGTAGSLSMWDGQRVINMKTDAMGMSDEGVKAIIEEGKNENIIVGTAGGLIVYPIGTGHARTYDELEGLIDKDVNAIAEDKIGNIWIGTNGGGLYKLDIHTDDSIPISFVANDSLLSSNTISSLIFQDDNTLIVGSNKGFDRVTLDEQQKIVQVRSYNSSDGFIGIECNENAICKDKEGNIWFGTVNGITRYSVTAENTNIPAPKIHITDIQLFYEPVNWQTKVDSTTPWFNLPRSLELPYSENHLTFYFAGISFANPQKVRYQYILEGQDRDWSPISKENKVTYSGINPGEYTFMVKAVNAEGVWSEPVSIHFVIHPPWYRTTWFYATVIVVLILGFYSFVKFREKKLKEEKAILEQKVAERTKEVVEQKEVIEEKNKEIMDSINYAKGIQDAILPNRDLISEHLPQSFVLFKPKDVVSGDFFYFIPLENGDDDKRVIWTAADCTGHGVPGAFVSMVGANGLNRTVNEYGITEPAKILDKLSLLVEQTFSKRKDGMDMSLCNLSSKGDTHLLQYAGANNPLWVIRKKGKNLLVNNEEITPDLIEEDCEYVLYEVKANKQPIGAFEDRQPFTNNNIQLESGDSTYVFSDGYADQFGGPKGKKFKYKPFKLMLLNMQEKTMEEQKNILNTTIEEWRGAIEQIDDICIFGVKV